VEQSESEQGGIVRKSEPSLIGTSSAVRSLFEQITVAARERYPVWVFGEEGVDRELVCQLIHTASPWAAGDCFAIDVSGLPAGLVRRELFGAQAGAISDLPSDHNGALSRVRQGTLLVEGIDSPSKDIQEELSQALSSGRFHPVGSSAERTIECRVIAAGQAPLDTLVRRGQLIRSLADRFSTLEIRVASLRERREDIPLIAAHALKEIREQVERSTGSPCRARSFSSAAQTRLVSYDWPGNDRELREQVRAAVALAAGEEIRPEDFLLGWSDAERVPSFREAKRAFEREYVTRLLRVCRGNISQAARLAQKDRKDFYDVMRRNSINPAEFR
jgi:two-component system response regulator GlrR